MTTSLDIDEDAVARVRPIAERDGGSLGALVSDYARRTLEPSEVEYRNGVPLLPRRPAADPVTPELVRRLKDELI
jgi:hypothetical protein